MGHGAVLVHRYVCRHPEQILVQLFTEEEEGLNFDGAARRRSSSSEFKWYKSSPTFSTVQMGETNGLYGYMRKKVELENALFAL